MLNWTSEHQFSLGDEHFWVDISPGKDRRPSDADAFTIVKHRAFLERYTNLVDQLDEKPKSILELGIFEGGGFVFIDQLFKPRCIAAVDIRKEPVGALVDYCARETASGRQVSAYFDSSQSNADLLNKIVAEDFDGQLDMVVDDASHTYPLSRASFEILFPLLKPGGTYIIEDWAWAHTASHAAGDHPWHNEPSLSRLIFELVANLGMSRSIEKIEVVREFVVVTKSKCSGELPTMEPSIRGRGWPLI